MNQQDQTKDIEEILDDYRLSCDIDESTHHQKPTTKDKNWLVEQTIRHTQEATQAIEQLLEEKFKSGFYVGQASAGTELEDCHTNWRKYNE